MTRAREPGEQALGAAQPGSPLPEDGECTSSNDRYATEHGYEVTSVHDYPRMSAPIKETIVNTNYIY